MRGKAHDPAVKAQVMAALMAGQGVGEVARKYELDSSVVSRWRKSMGEGELHEVATKTRDRFGDLLATYLEETLITLAVQVRHFRDPAWLQRQPADSLAVLHGVATDKAIRLLEALETGEREDAGEDPS